MRDIFKEYPEITRVFEQHAGFSDDLKALITLAAEMSYRDGFLDGMIDVLRRVLTELGPKLAWVALFTMAVLAANASDWPYGVATRIFR
jgi:hypothetical protein